MKLQILVDRRDIRFPAGINDVLMRAAEQHQTNASDYCRTAILDRLRADGFLQTGRRLQASLSCGVKRA